MKPLVSILMSVYNGERWLREAIESVRVQTFRDFEFLLVDDGSRDATRDILAQYSREDPRIRVFHKTNSGLADSLNYGISLASGHWIARIDADDIFEPGKIEAQLEFAQKNSKLALIGTGLKLINYLGDAGAVYRYPSDHQALVDALQTGRPFFAHSSVMYKRELVAALGGYRPRIKNAQDHDLWLRISERSEMGCLAEPLVQIRKHDEQISNEHNGVSQLLDNQVALVSYWLRRFGHPDPVESASTLEFQRFVSWVSRQEEIQRLILTERFLNETRLRLISEGSLIGRLWCLARAALLNPKEASARLLARYVGTSIAKQLALNWYRSYER
jgi:glycosyltransferase involved in cell wall biosynthesis